MSYCSMCGEHIHNQAVVCPNCGVQVREIRPAVSDNSGFGWGILGFLIPLVGFILYLSWNTGRPNSARWAGIGALVGFAFSFFFLILLQTA